MGRRWSGKVRKKPHHGVTREDVVDERGDLDWESKVLGRDGVDRQARLQSEQKPSRRGTSPCRIIVLFFAFTRDPASEEEGRRRITHQLIDHPDDAEEVIIRR
jgi:hypothetical protein